MFYTKVEKKVKLSCALQYLLVGVYIQTLSVDLGWKDNYMPSNPFRS